MLAPLIGIVKRRIELRNPKAYKISFVPWYTMMGKLHGEGWYIIAPRVDPIGPLTSRVDAEDSLIAILDEIRGTPMQDDEKKKVREYWK